MGIASGNPTWQGKPSTATPVTAARLNAIEGALDANADRATAIEAKVIDLQAHGAVGDGVADDTATIQAAITTGTAGSRVTGSGSYRLTGQLTIPAGVTLSGLTLAFVSTAATVTGGALQTNGADIIITGCDISVTGGDYRRTINLSHDRCSARNNLITVTTPNVPSGNAHYAIFSADGGIKHGVTIEGNEIVMTTVPKGDGVQVSSRPGVRVAGNYVHDFASMAEVTRLSWGIYVSTNCPGAVVSGNRVENVVTSGITLNGTGSSPADYGRRVTGNVVKGAQFVGLGAGACVRPVLSGNHVEGCDLPISIESTVISPIISGNTITNVISLGSPIDSDRPMAGISGPGAVVTGNEFGARGGALIGVKLAGSAADSTVAGNNFTDDRPRVVVAAYAGAPRALITGNVIAATTDATAGNCISANVADVTVTGNTIAMPANGTAISLNGANCQARGNRIIGGATGLAVGSSGASCALVGNYVSGATTPLYDSGTATKKYQNVGVTPPSVTGSRGGNAALAALLTQLAAADLITDGTSA